MNWIIFTAVNFVWIVCVLTMRYRYRKLLKEAIVALDGVFHAMPDYDKRKIGRVLSDIRATTGL